MIEFVRGEIYYINFPYTFDKRYPNGKDKFVVVLQEGEYFRGYNTINCLLITSEEEEKDYETSVVIGKGTTLLNKESYVICSQVYTLDKSLFNGKRVWKAGQLDPIKLDEIDEALFLGLCMGKQNEDNLDV